MVDSTASRYQRTQIQATYENISLSNIGEASVESHAIGKKYMAPVKQTSGTDLLDQFLGMKSEMKPMMSSVTNYEEVYAPLL